MRAASMLSSTTSTRIPFVSRGIGSVRRSLRGWAGRAARGSVTVNVLPVPGPSLAAAIVPPWSSHRLRAIVRPMPSPPCARSIVRSPWTNISNSCGSNSGAIPGPRSRTSTTIASPVSRAATWIGVCGPLYFDALIRRFWNTCASRTGSASTSSPSRGTSIDSACCFCSISGAAISIARAITVDSSRTSFARSSRPRHVHEVPTDDVALALHGGAALHVE